MENQKMTLDEEMKLWETRANDEFGTILKEIRSKTSEIVLDIIDGMNQYIAIYSVHGEAARKSITNQVEHLLTDYDILDNYPNIKKLVNELNLINMRNGYTKHM